MTPLTEGEIEAIRERRRPGSRQAMSRSPTWPGWLADFDALLDEVMRLRTDLADVTRLLVDEHDTHHENCCVDADDMCHVGQVLARIESVR